MGNPLTILRLCTVIRYVSYLSTKSTGKVRFVRNHALSTRKQTVLYSTEQNSTVQYRTVQYIPWCLERGFSKTGKKRSLLSLVLR